MPSILIDRVDDTVLVLNLLEGIVEVGIVSWPMRVITFGSSTVYDSRDVPCKIVVSNKHPDIEIRDGDNRLVFSGKISSGGQDFKEPKTSKRLTPKIESLSDSEIDVKILHISAIKNLRLNPKRKPSSPTSTSTPKAGPISVTNTPDSTAIRSPLDITPKPTANRTTTSGFTSPLHGLTLSTNEHPRTAIDARHSSEVQRPGDTASNAIDPEAEPTTSTTVRRTTGAEAPQVRRPISRQLRTSEALEDHNLHAALSNGSQDNPLVQNSKRKRLGDSQANQYPYQKGLLLYKPRPSVHTFNDRLSKRERVYLSMVINDIRKQPAAAEFLKPVDYVRRKIPNYRAMIKRPMDLGTIAQKLKATTLGSYASVSKFVADFDLMIRNASIFNGPDHEISQDGQELKRVLDGYLASFANQQVSIPMARLLFAQGPMKREETTTSCAAAHDARPQRKKLKVDYRIGHLEEDMEDTTYEEKPSKR